MPTNKSHITKHINRKIYLLSVLLCVMLLSVNVKAQKTDTITSEYLGSQGTPLNDSNFDADKLDSDKTIVRFEKLMLKYNDG
jgi:hypothetical protein